MFFQNIYTSLTLNGQFYTKPELLQLRKTTNLPKWQQSLYQFIQDWLENSPYIEVQTSGSTGTPKCIRLEKERMVNSAKRTGQYFQFKKGQRALLCLPCDYIAGKMMVVRAFVWALDLWIVPPAGNPMTVQHQRFDFAAMIPMQVSNIVEQTPEKFQLLQQLIIGGGKVNRSLYQQLQQLPTQCYATYGMTETITHIAIQQLNGAGQSAVYNALPSVKLSLDERGCLIIDASDISTEKVVTNDIVRLINDQQFEWLGRLDNVINTGGVKVFPEQIEKKLENFINNRFFISFLPSEKLGQQVIVIIEATVWTPQQLLDFKERISKVLSKYELPKQYFFVEHFLETPTGKVQRTATKACLKLS